MKKSTISSVFPATRPLGLSRSDGKRPDGLSLVPWEAGKPLTWDVTVICPLADSYVAAAARETGSAEEAATRKTAKYSSIQAHHIFQPVAVESLGPINASGRIFLSKLGRKLADQSGDDREISFLFLATLRAFSGTMPSYCMTALIFVIFLYCIAYVLIPWELSTGVKKTTTNNNNNNKSVICYLQQNVQE